MELENRPTPAETFGWPTPALVEILIDVYGIGELQLLLPLMRVLTRNGPQPPLVVWLNAPCVPNGVALAQHRVHARHWLTFSLAERDVLWATEHSLRASACSMVLAWASSSNTAALRRLKLAAMSSQCIGILFRPTADAKHPSPASLRILLRPYASQLSVEILKNEGRKPSHVTIDVRSSAIDASASTSPVDRVTLFQDLLLAVDSRTHDRRQFVVK